MTHWDTELHQYLPVLLCPAPISSIWPLDKVGLVLVSGLQCAALGRCAVRPLRNNDTPPKCPTSIYLYWENTDDQLSGKQQNISRAMRIQECSTRCPTHPLLFDCLASKVGEGKWCDSGQKCWQLCQKWFYVISKFTWDKQRGKHDSSEERRAKGWCWPPPDPTLRRLSESNHQSLSVLVTV